MGSTFKKLQKKIKADLSLDVIDFQRTYASREMLSSGAYSWTAKLNGSDFNVVSTESATTLLNRKIEIIESSMVGFFELI